VSLMSTVAFLDYHSIFKLRSPHAKKILNSTSIVVARPMAAVVLTAEDGEDGEGLRYERNVSIYRCGQIPKLHAR
jgi:hypothetical protein